METANFRLFYTRRVPSGLPFRKITKKTVAEQKRDFVILEILNLFLKNARISFVFLTKLFTVRVVPIKSIR